MSRPRLLDLFSGIGGFSLGLERAGFETVAFCEIDSFCQRVLAKHWPEVPQYDDIRTLTAERLAADGIAVDAICGGLPCQGLSKAGKGRGLADPRSALWFEFARLIEEIGPRVVILENVTALRRRGLDIILRFFASIRYDAEWHCAPAGAIGAPDVRDRLWVIAYPQHSNAHGVGPHTAPLNLAGSSELQNKQDGLAGPLLSALPRRRDGLGQEPVETGIPNPEYGEWLTGLQPRWTELEPSETA
ncbi:MAG: DNA cytosine methyltransferase [Brevundimonas sp.]|nr:MAG: DNA cytosine methyltransferase [Brevundimonas sp.]